MELQGNDWTAIGGFAALGSMLIAGVKFGYDVFKKKNLASEISFASQKTEIGSNTSNNNSNITTVVINSPPQKNEDKNNTNNLETESKKIDRKKKFKTIDNSKASLRILFIDDKNFKVVDTLILAGWAHVDSKQDISNLDEDCIKTADFIFVDIQGVGKKMGFKDEGLGLAKAILDRHPLKYLVIYSAIPKGDRFHESLRLADDFLNKNADDYEFEKCIIDLVTNER